ncbi:hypothetical protein NSK_006487 [Nannochloropsis salina CCMP1776]|uniref:Uncharacterized protein n=1 Tax=Nannochloropsis salina CCMP1776 TaxID=1027361 RepID=A0A4D9D0I3_9STRA|nr:hypothetical protein NSK_006487 [Nannochloropsis salina CCMP1776]|eukprot:TFJ82158.1 hypothetical protein NSK_006487 [Nannochloropsis salina CCMP1776]
MNSVRQLASVTQTAARSVAGRHVRNLSTSASPSGTGVPAGTFAGKCRCWPNPPCHHHATGACGYSQFECDGGAGGGCSPAQYHQAAASGSSSIQTSTSQILAGASQAVGRQCQTLLNGMLFDTDRAAAMTGKDRSFSYSR